MPNTRAGYMLSLVILFSASAWAKPPSPEEKRAIDLLDQANQALQNLNRNAAQPGQMGRKEDIVPQGNFNDEGAEDPDGEPSDQFLDDFDAFMKRDDFGQKPAPKTPPQPRPRTEIQPLEDPQIPAAGAG